MQAVIERGREPAEFLNVAVVLARPVLFYPLKEGGSAIFTCDLQGMRQLVAQRGDWYKSAGSFQRHFLVRRRCC